MERHRKPFNAGLSGRLIIGAGGIGACATTVSGRDRTLRLRANRAKRDERGISYPRGGPDRECTTKRPSAVSQAATCSASFDQTRDLERSLSLATLFRDEDVRPEGVGGNSDVRRTRGVGPAGGSGVGRARL